MKTKNKIMIAAVAGMFAVISADAQTEIQPSAKARVQTTANTDATVISEPSGADTHHHSGMNRFGYDKHSGDELYPDQEFSIDIFGAFADEKRKFNDAFDTTQRNGRWGAGVGVNYFFTRNLGIGADAFGLDNNGGLVDAASASFIFRLPLDVAHLAPYGFVGGGRQFEGPDSWTAHVGAGFEVRLNPHTGIFLDGRYAFLDKGSDYTLLRSGLRLIF